MSCEKTRRVLIRRELRSAELARHLVDCDACRRFAGRLEAARALLGRRRANVEPGPEFVARVRARLDDDPAAQLGRAALRLLPATVALLLLLGWFAWQNAPVQQIETIQSPTDDLWTWVLDDDGGGS